MAAWTLAEHRVILNTFAVEGRRWGKISRLPALENRTSASIRNRFLRIEKGAKLRDVHDNLQPRVWPGPSPRLDRRLAHTQSARHRRCPLTLSCFYASLRPSLASRSR